MEESLGEKIIKLRLEGLTYNQIREKLKCGKATISYHCRKHGLSDSNKMRTPSEEEKKEFQRLYDELESTRKVAKITGWSRFTVTKYIVLKDRTPKTDKEKKESSVQKVIDWRKRTKQKLINYKGGCCQSCGYKKCIEALEFHHIDSNEKEMTIGGSTRSFERLKDEADKCVLVCANCHREIHAGIIFIEDFI